jgi:hypothetical protein
MNKTKIFLSLVLALSVLILQVGGVLAAPALQESDLLAGIVKSITLETDPNTGITTAIIVVKSADQPLQTLRISQETAIAVGLVALDGDGNPVINKRALGKPVEIDPAKIIPDQPTDRYPVGNALETFFKDIDGVNYDVIMKAHEDGTGFGVIAQVLWLTQQIPGGDVADFQALLFAKQNNDYTSLPFDLVDENGTTITPKNWGQLRKAILDGNQVDKSNNTVSNQNNGNDQNHENNKNKDKDKKDKDKDNSGNNEKGNGKGK